MKKLLITSLLFMLFVTTASSQNWSDDVIKVKKEIVKNLKQVKSDVKRHKNDSEKISVDVTGWNDLILYSWGTEDGNSWDHGVWGNAILTANDGTKVKVSEMTFAWEQAPYGSPKRDANLSNKPLSVNGKVFKHGVIIHADGMIAIDLAGKYKTFEAEVGIDDAASKVSSTVFIVKNTNTNLELQKLATKYPVETSTITSTGRLSADDWLLNLNGDAEKKAALNISKLLNKSTSYVSKINSVTGSDDEKIKSLLSIIDEINNVVEIQKQLQWIKIDNVKNAFNDMKSVSGYDAAKYGAKLAQVEQLIKEGTDIYSGNKSDIENAKKVITLTRDILLSNKALDGDRIILGRYKLGNNARSVGAQAMGTQPNNWTNILSANRLGYDAEISEMTNIRSEKPVFKTVYKPKAKVAVSDLMLHWDADKILFSSINDKGLWNVFEVGTDGSGLQEVIKVDDPDLEFFDGTFLPSGKFIANSNIGYHGVPCVDGYDVVGNMVLYDPADKSLRRITFDQDANWHPVVMNSGKVMYIRWEYTDLTHYFSRITMYMNPDGTEQKALYGSGDFFPNSTFDIQPLPNSTSKFIAVASGHHGTVRSGRLLLIDPAKSRKKLEGIVQEIPFSKRPIDPIIKDELVDGVWPQFIKPRPINDKYFLVTAKVSPQSLWGLYLVDIYDNMTLITESEGEGLINAMYIEKKATPPVIPDRVNLEDEEATVYIQDIYEGEGLPGVPRGEVKKLRVFTYEYAYIKSPSNHSAQGIQSGWDIKRILGEVDVNLDGSTSFKVPANTPISLQPLDSEGRAIQWMRSWFTAMPGEIVSCVGCHEDLNMLPVTKPSEASKQKPQIIAKVDGGVRSITYELEIQPILDRACVACHNSNSGLNLEANRMDEKINMSHSYLNLHPFISRQGSEADIKVMKPYEYHATTSELVRLLENDHYGVELTEQEWKNLYTWIDLNAPYHGAFRQNDLKGFNQIKRRQELAKKYNNIQVDWVQEIEDYSNILKAKGKITPVKPDYEAPKYKNASAKGWPFNTNDAIQKQDDLGDNRKELDLGNGTKMVFRKIPAGSFVMGSNKYGKESAPESRVKISKSFWIGEIEVTNEQYNALVPEHNSRYIAQFWKDHTGPGYPANRPGQPAIRVSYDEVMEFCKMLSQKTGLNITLPTEAQWEWAARAGTNSEFWFGNLNTDFAKYENMADVNLEKMAVSGVNPQPMSKNSFWFKYYNFIPKSETIDDKNMLLVEGKFYKANPWGLYDMLGNVREWTKSDFVPYPYSSKSKVETNEKVIRGGAWIDRNKFSTSYSRKSALSWQKLNNVGFRVIIEE